ncbi:Serine/threonine-protein kinase pkn1 [Gimesia fumaroli]|uniref:Serine/threonine-protein kinase pkn1 n=2 Tax=Gimesia fumaroli TaxID=2527976 RepID=A0A518IEX7_9PLAN|nr:Serine/threonine-protein kinase pkn1 [Gimesia fumaroli]
MNPFKSHSDQNFLKRLLFSFRDDKIKGKKVLFLISLNKLVLMMLRNPKQSEVIFFTLTGVILLLTVGCSEDQPVVQPSQKPLRDTSSSQMRAPKMKPSKSVARKKKKVKAKQPELAGNPDDMFEVVDYIHNFEVKKTGVPYQATEQVAVMFPEKPEINSTTFKVVKNVAQAEQPAADSSFKLPKGFSAVKEAGYSDRGLPKRIRCERDYSEMVLVPAGVSVQGVTNGEKNTSPEFTIYQDAFYIDVHEVTLEKYRRWRSEMIAEKGKIPEPAENDGQPADFPAMGVSYTDALNYARTMGKQLPHETQWEKAARGESGFQYPWGNGRALWQKTRLPGQIDPVGTFLGDQSPYGVMDLAGNAREWCDDWYSQNAYQAALALSDAGVVRGWTGPRRPVVPSMRVVRGNQKSWEVWKRSGENMRTPPADVGFRCVLNLASAPNAEAEQSKPANAF